MVLHLIYGRVLIKLITYKKIKLKVSKYIMNINKDHRIDYIPCKIL